MCIRDSTRCAFTVAAIDEGGHPEYLGKNDIQLGHKEDVADTARVLGRMFDGIEFRGFSQKVVEDLAKYAGVPVWNGLTDDYHPTQVLADFLDVYKRQPYISLYAFSTENWKRPKGEVLGLMGLFRYYMNSKLNELGREKTRMRFAGDLAALPEDIRQIPVSYTHLRTPYQPCRSGFPRLEGDNEDRIS